MNLEERIRLCKDYTRLWSDFFKTFSEGLHNKKILPNEEIAYNQMVALLSFKHFKFAEMMGSYLPDPDGILEVLCDSVSLQHLKTLSEAQFSKLQVNWHTEFIAMNKCLGKLLAELPTDKRTEHELKKSSRGHSISNQTGKAAPTPASGQTSTAPKSR